MLVLVLLLADAVVYEFWHVVVDYSLSVSDSLRIVVSVLDIQVYYFCL